MKYFYFIAAFFLPMQIFAQQTIQFSSNTWPVGSGTCPTGLTWVSLYANVSGLNPATDSIDFYVDFGDGYDTLRRLPVQVGSFNQQFANWGAQHTYLSSGVYSPVCIGTTPNGTADTIVMTNGFMLPATCNNLRGHVYRDADQNCVRNSGDDSLYSQAVQIRVSGSDFYWSALTDTDGYFESSLIPGYSYEINFRGAQNLYVPLECVPNDTFVFTATGNDTVDLGLTGSPLLNITDFTDSLGPVCYGTGDVSFYSHIYYFGDDSVMALKVYIDYGDGNDTLYTRPIYYYTSQYHKQIQLYNVHHYPSTGVYSVMVIVTDTTTGMADTLFKYNEVELEDSCGNISGRVFMDSNADCIFTNADDSLQNVLVYLEQNQQVILGDFTDASGRYSFDVAPGQYDVMINTIIPGSGYQMTCNTTATRTVTAVQLGTVTEDFGMVCATSLYDDGSFLGGHGMRPGSVNAKLFPYIYHNFCNNGSGTATVILDPLTTYIGSSDTSIQYTVNGNTISWPYTAAFNNYPYWEQQPYLILGVDTAAQIGDTVCFTMIITPTVQDNNPANDTFYLCQAVNNSYDPNAKEVYPNGPGGNGHVAPNTELLYKIYFQNTGNDTAYNIAIMDTLDPNLDITSLQVIGFSHQAYAETIGTNVLRFNFNGIYLPDSTTNEPLSHGWVMYKIKMLPGLANGTVINNTADIYFDFNAPVITNTTQTIVDWILSTKELSTGEPSLYPVPADEEITIESETEMSGTIQILDLSGRMVRSESVNGKRAKLYTGDLANGTYIVTILDGNTLMKKKIVIQH